MEEHDASLEGIGIIWYELQDSGAEIAVGGLRGQSHPLWRGWGGLRHDELARERQDNGRGGRSPAPHRAPQDRQYSRPGGRTRTTAIARSKRTATCLDRMEHRTTRRGGNGRGGRSPDGTAERRRSGGTAAIARSRKAATRSDRMEHRTTAGESPWEFRLNDGAPRRGEGSHKDAARRSEGNMSIYLYERRRSDGTAAPTGAHGPPPSQGPGGPPYFQTGWSTGPPRVRGNGRGGRSPAPVERRRSDGTAAPAGAHVPPPLQGPEGPLSRQDGAPDLTKRRQRSRRP